MRDMNLEERYLRSLDADNWIFKSDVLVDKAHTVMLYERGIISKSATSKILRALRELELSSIDLSSHEDVHVAIESELIRKIGEDGGRIHTGRSRNDEVATCIRISLRDDLLSISDELSKLRKILLNKAEQHRETILPGYTHLQHAQPTTLAHYFLAHHDPFKRDFKRLMNAFDRTNLNPLGSAALASTTFPVNRDRTKDLLGFDGLIENAMDAVSTRDFVIEAIAAFSNLMTNLSRLAEEMILWSTSEFDFIRINEDYVTGSSIMPQKRNPDVAELIRARTGSVYGCLMSVLSICKALPYSYNRDLQEVTPHLLRSIQLTLDSIQVMTGMVKTMDVNVDEMRSKLTPEIMATDLVDRIVRTSNTPFRKAHQRIKSSITDLEKDLDPMDAVRNRSARGGVAPDETKRMIGDRLKGLELDERDLDEKRERVEKAIYKLDEIVRQF